MDFKMTANENAITQPKFELGITGIIQKCVSELLDHKTEKLENCWKKINFFPQEGGGYPSMENSTQIINIFEPFPEYGLLIPTHGGFGRISHEIFIKTYPLCGSNIIYTKRIPKKYKGNLLNNYI